MGGGVEAFVAACKKNIGDVVSLACPFGESRSAEEFRVIGMGEDDENAKGGVPNVSVCQVWIPVSALSEA